MNDETQELCAQFVPTNVASVDLSDSADLKIRKLSVSHMWVRFDPPSRHQSYNALSQTGLATLRKMHSAVCRMRQIIGGSM